MSAEPSFQQWLEMSDSERDVAQSKWKTYEGDGAGLNKAVAERFKREFGSNSDLDIHGGLDHGGTLVIGVSHPFIYDSRKIPDRFLGFHVKKLVNGELPEEFKVKDNQKEYVWAPERYEKFVKRCPDLIRQKLGRADMSEKEMLDALVGYDFEEHKAMVNKSIRESTLPKYEDPNR